MEIVGILHAEEAAEIQASPGKLFNDLEKQRLWRHLNQLTMISELCCKSKSKELYLSVKSF